MYSNPDSDTEGCITVADWKDPRTPVIIGGAQYYKDLHHWYGDGNIILIVQDNVFRVFQSVLIKRSQVMNDMLGLPTPTATDDTKGSVSDGQPSFEGVPVVVLDDKARYFQLLLDALLPRGCDRLPISEDLRREDLMGVTQIAKKYEFDDVAAHAVSVLENILPTKDQPDKTISGSYSSSDIRSWVQVINWARLCGLPQFLPLPFYHLATNEWKDANHRTLKAFQKLSPQDQWRIHIGRERLQALIFEIGVSRRGRQCRHDDCCMTQNGPTWTFGTEDERLKNLLLHPLEELNRREGGYLAGNLCDVCSRFSSKLNQKMKDQIVQKLGSCFTLADEVSEFGGCP